MSDEPSKMDSLRSYLLALPLSAQAMLLHEIEKARLRGEGEPAHGVIADVLRAVIRDEHARAKRAGTPQRLFCEPLEPFLVDEKSSRKYSGFILRESLNAIWRWLCEVPDLADFDDLADQATEALAKGDYAEARQITATLRARAHPVMSAALQSASSHARDRMQLASRLGGERGVDEMADVAAVLRLEDRLARLAAKLPRRIEHLTPELAERLLRRLDDGPGDIVFPVMVIYRRLASPAELLQLLVAAAGTDDAAKLRSHRLACCVDIVFAELDFAIERIIRDVSRPAEFETLVASIRHFHALASGMPVSININGAEDWRARLADRRRRASEILGEEVARAPGAIRRVMKPRRRDKGGMAPPDSSDVTDAEHAARLMVALRPYRSEVAVNEILAGVGRQVETFVEAANGGILQDLRSAQGADKEAARAVFRAALRINEIVFGKDYTTLLRRSGRMADPGAVSPESGQDDSDACVA
jgi:hypothetical protein